LVLVALSVIEQRYRAVVAVLDGASVTEVAREVGVSRQSVHVWVARYRRAGLPGLVDGSHRPQWCPHQASPELEALVCELRRAHPRWGALRILHELMRGPSAPEPLPSRASVHRILVRHGLVVPRARRRKRSDYVRWQRPAAMQLWQLDIVYGPRLVDVATGEVREARIVTGVDDHSRYCVLARVVERATGRAVCLAFTEALQRFGAPEEVLTDNGQQFTARFSRGGEVLFDKICRRNGIAHRLTQPRSPTTTGKIERFHQTLRRDLLDDARPFVSLLAAQAALDDWVREYNADRPHQALELRAPVTPADRFQAAPDEQRDLLPLWLPGALASVSEPAGAPTRERALDAGAAPIAERGPVELDRVIPLSGNLWVARRQFWLGPARAGQTVRFWASVDVIHLSIAGVRVKSLRSHLSAADLAELARHGAIPAGPPPLPAVEPGGGAVEVERTVSNSGIVSLAHHQVLAAEILGGRRVAIRIDAATLLFFDPDTGELLRSRPNPLTAEEIRGLRGARPAGPPPRPRTEPVTVQRRVSATGVITVCRQQIPLGRIHAGRTVTVHVSEHTLAIELDHETRTVRRTTSRPVVVIKGSRPYERRPQPHRPALSSSAERETEQPQ
jgi:transposase InsO family protein